MATNLLLKKDIKEKKELVNIAIDRYLPRKDEYPKQIHKAMRYTLFAGGKRLRSYLMINTYKLFRDNVEKTYEVAGAIEILHTYTLIHDDLPAIDNDDKRRGRKACHVIYGDDIALLAGDALLVSAFDVINSSKLEEKLKLQIIKELSHETGSTGLIGGQMVDILSEGKKILIDGQQRVTALTAAIIGQQVVNKDYKKIRIQIAFNPLEEKFETLTPAIAKDKKWIDDISTVFNGNLFDIVGNYLEQNPDANKIKIQTVFQDLINIPKKQIGLIELSGELDIEKVTEIFIRINSQGVELSQADFVMSKIAANENYGGNLLRKTIDYFSHLAVAPEFYSHIAENDTEFSKTDYFQKISWLKNENGDLYDPTYKDILRVAFTFKFNRGKLSDLVSLLSGRNFETREYEEEIAKQSYDTLITGVKDFINETNFKRFLMIITSAGFVDNRLIRSVNAMNFAYILYLKLKEQGYNSALIEKYVKKWFVLTLLTGRYSGSPESRFDFDIKNNSMLTF